MSLIAWYPLNGDLKDHSGYKNHLNNTYLANIVVDPNNGKVGKCYNFDGIGYLSSKSPVIYTKVTFAAWIYWSNDDISIIGIINNFNHGVGTGSNISLYIENTGIVKISIADKNNIVSNISYSSTYAVITKNKWYHVTVSIDTITGEIKFYIDGIYKDTKNIDIKYLPLPITSKQLMIGQWAWTYATEYKFIGKLNDIRVYDHILSNKEVREIYKTCILHYNFNDPYEECTENLFPQPYTNSQFGMLGFGYFIIMRSNNEITYRYDYNQALLNTWHGFNIEVDITAQYTFSFDAYVSTDCNAQPGVMFIANCEQGMSAKFDYDLSKKGQWQHFEHTAIPTKYISALLYPTTATLNATSGYVLYKNVQVEKKDHSTPFIDGIRNNIIVDSSGYGYNGSVKNIDTCPGWTKDTNIGIGCFKFDGVDDAIVIDKFPANLFCGSWTIAFYAYNDMILDRDIYFGDNGISSSSTNINIERIYNLIRLYWRGIDISSIPCIIEGWQHICISYNKDNKQLNMYIDGVNIFSNIYDLNNLLVVSSFYLGRDGRIGQTAFSGNISDFKIYAVALSGDDINNLYNSKYSISKNGDLYCNSIIETGIVTNKFSLETDSVLRCNSIDEVNISESSELKISKNNIIIARSFNEI